MTYQKKKPNLEQLESIADKLGNALGLLAFLDHGILPTQIETIVEVHEEIIDATNQLNEKTASEIRGG